MILVKDKILGFESQLKRDQRYNCCHGSSTSGVILLLSWCTVLMPSLKNTAPIYLEIFWTECISACRVQHRRTYELIYRRVMLVSMIWEVMPNWNHLLLEQQDLVFTLFVIWPLMHGTNYRTLLGRLTPYRCLNTNSNSRSLRLNGRTLSLILFFFNLFFKF